MASYPLDIDHDPIKISPNGKFVYYITQEKNDDNNKQERIKLSSLYKSQVEHASNKKNDRAYYPSSNEKLTAHIFELTLVRAKSVHESLVKSIQPFKDSKRNEEEFKKIKKDSLKIKLSGFENHKIKEKNIVRVYEKNNELKKGKERKKIQKIKDKIYNSKVEFELRPIRKFENLDTYFGTSFDPIITDLGSLALFNSVEHRLLYEQIELTSSIENQLGEDDKFNKLKVADYEWRILQTGFLGFRADKIYYINLEVKVDRNSSESQYKIDVKYIKTIPISLILGEGELIVRNVFAWPDSSKWVFELSDLYEEQIFLVWSLDANIEVKNFSTSGFTKLIYGSGSKTGYIFNKVEDKIRYTNLDNGLPNAFFDFHIELEYANYFTGKKISYNEDILLDNGTLINKSKFLHINTISKILGDPEYFSWERFSLDWLSFQIEGNTIFHMFWLDSEKLEPLLELFLLKNNSLLSSILMKNYQGYSPFGISLERDSRKTTDLFLRILSSLPEGSYSGQLYQYIPDLIFKNSKAFHVYLDSCFFQTIQMKNTMYLSLKSDTDKLVIFILFYILIIMN